MDSKTSTVEVDGIPVVLDEDRFDNIEVLELMMRFEDGDASPTTVAKLAKLMLGEEQYEATKEQLKGDDGICHATDYLAFIEKVFSEANSTPLKN